MNSSSNPLLTWAISSSSLVQPAGWGLLNPLQEKCTWWIASRCLESKPLTVRKGIHRLRLWVLHGLELAVDHERAERHNRRHGRNRDVFEPERALPPCDERYRCICDEQDAVN